MLSFYVLYCLAKFYLPISYVGIFSATLTLSDTTSNLAWGWLGDRIGYLSITIAASLLICLGQSWRRFFPIRPYLHCLFC